MHMHMEMGTDIETEKCMDMDRLTSLTDITKLSNDSVI